MPLYPSVEPKSSDFPKQPALETLPDDELKGGPAPWRSLTAKESAPASSDGCMDDLASPIVFGGGVFGQDMYNSSETLASDLPIRTVRLALRYGINAFDTSPYYFPSEFTLGAILTRLESEFPRSSYYITTKCGRYGPDAKHFDYSPEKVDSSVRASCRRLGTSYLDVALMHDAEFVAEKVGRSHNDGWESGVIAGLVDPVSVGLTQTRDEMIQSLGLASSLAAASKSYGPGDEKVLGAVRALFKLKDEGVIRQVGISGYPLPVLLRLSRLVATNAPYRPLDTILSYSNHCLHSDVLPAWSGLFAADPRAEDVSTLPELQWKPPVIVNGSPFSMGLLTDGSPPPWHPASEALTAATKAASALLTENGSSLTYTALTYGLRGSQVAQTQNTKHPKRPQLRALVGLSRPDHVHSAIDAYRTLCAGVTDNALYPVSSQDRKEAYRIHARNEQLVRNLFAERGVREWSWSSGL